MRQPEQHPTPSPPRHHRLLGVVACLLLLLGLCAALAPYLDAELMRWLVGQRLVNPNAPKLARGRMLDDYFALEELGPGIYGLGEPRYWQKNYSYLIVGERRAVLFDAGSGTHDLAAVVRQITSLPVTVMASHLHFDHLGGIGAFEHVAMLDLPQTRRDVHQGILRPGRYEYWGFIEGKQPPAVHVAEWWAPGTRIDLGGRFLTVLSTPGHTASSAALYDEAAHTLFVGDLIYPTTLYAFLPGASLSAYRQTTERLLALLPADATLWTAHCCRRDEGNAAPRLGVGDLKALHTTLEDLEHGRLRGSGFYPRKFPVNEQMTLATGFPWNNR